MKPGDHPEFFRMAAPPGASRESTIRLDADGRFWHDGARVEHAALEAALHGWIARHPEDGRFILTNGYDWTYFQVDDAPYTVRAVRPSADGATMVLQLSDGSEEALDPSALGVGPHDALYTKVKGAAYEARFSRHAQIALGPWLEEGAGEGSATLLVGDRRYPIGPRNAAARRDAP